jgi:hypothetical protein
MAEFGHPTRPGRDRLAVRPDDRDGSLQAFLPAWVRARWLSMFNIVFAGGQAVGASRRVLAGLVLLEFVGVAGQRVIGGHHPESTGVVA